MEINKLKYECLDVFLSETFFQHGSNKIWARWEKRTKEIQQDASRNWKEKCEELLRMALQFLKEA